MAIAAAADGLGVALESTRLARREMAQGKLVAPLAGRSFDIKYVGHHLCYPKSGSKRRLVRRFADWLLVEIGEAPLVYSTATMQSRKPRRVLADRPLSGKVMRAATTDIGAKLFACSLPAPFGALSFVRRSTFRSRPIEAELRQAGRSGHTGRKHRLLGGLWRRSEFVSAYGLPCLCVPVGRVMIEVIGTLPSTTRAIYRRSERKSGG